MRTRIVTIIAILTIGLFYKPLFELLRLSFKQPLLSHAFMIPLVSSYLLWTQRKVIFSTLEYSPTIGVGLMTMSQIIYIIQWFKLGFLSQNDTLFVSISCVVIWIWGGFLLVCGRRVFIRALFPLIFLVFMIPIPSWVLGPVVRFLQLGSVYVTQAMLRLFDVPAYFEGISIMLPGVTVEVVEECSGIRSAVALLILSIFAGHLFLKSNWRRLILSLCIIIVAIIKNGMRITVLALLGSYVDISYLTDSVLHNWGGKPFFLVALVMISPVFWLLKRSEKEPRSSRRRNRPQKSIRQSHRLSNGEWSG